MAEPARPVPQAQLDAGTYEAYVRNREDAAATAGELAISVGTVATRVRRHLARAAQDMASESFTPAGEDDEAA